MGIAEIINLFESHNLLVLVEVFFLFNSSLILLEILIDFGQKRKRRWWDTLSNVSIFFLGQLTERVITGSLGILGLLPVFLLIPWEIPMTGWSWALGLLAADFTYHWQHRIEHETRFLWAGHSVHHSSEDYNLTVALRLSIVEGLYNWVFLIPMVIAGFNPFQVILCMIFVLQYQTWIHTERIGKLGILDKIFNTPSIHRVHHGSNKKYLDKNYGGILMIWDHLFGTFQGEEEKVKYGLTKNIKTNNPLKINFIEFRNIWRDVKKCRSFRDAMKIIFGDLTWRPKYFKKE